MKYPTVEERETRKTELLKQIETLQYEYTELTQILLRLRTEYNILNQMDVLEKSQKGEIKLSMPQE